MKQKDILTELAKHGKIGPAQKAIKYGKSVDAVRAAQRSMSGGSMTAKEMLNVPLSYSKKVPGVITTPPSIPGQVVKQGVKKAGKMSKLLKALKIGGKVAGPVGAALLISDLLQSPELGEGSDVVPKIEGVPNKAKAKKAISKLGTHKTKPQTNSRIDNQVFKEKEAGFKIYKPKKELNLLDPREYPEKLTDEKPSTDYEAEEILEEAKMHSDLMKINEDSETESILQDAQMHSELMDLEDSPNSGKKALELKRLEREKKLKKLIENLGN